MADDRTELISTPVEMLVPGLLGDGRHELHGVRKDGTEVPLEVRLNPLDTAAGELVLVSVVDIAERQRAERENRDLMEQIQHLAGSLITAQDAERARIARDLHDDVSQQLAALSIALSGLKRRVGPRAAAMRNSRPACRRSSSAPSRSRRASATSHTTCIPTCSSMPD